MKKCPDILISGVNICNRIYYQHQLPWQPLKLLNSIHLTISFTLGNLSKYTILFTPTYETIY